MCPASSVPSASVTTRCGPRASSERHLLHGEQLRAEAARLVVRAAREVGAREPVGEAEVVLDPRALAGLAARRLALDEHRAQPLRRAVHGGGEAGRAAADDHEVVEVELGLRREAELPGQLQRGRRLEHAAVAQEDGGQPVRRRCPRRRAAAGPRGRDRGRTTRTGPGCGPGSRARRATRGENRWPTTRAAASLSRASASQSPSRSSSVGYSRSSGGSHGFCR